ncbi:MAG: hypothetical protein RL497_2187 [Pseudomonadota bacterium]|jgi:zinc transport system substrate-binding protein
MLKGMRSVVWVWLLAAGWSAAAQAMQPAPPPWLVVSSIPPLNLLVAALVGPEVKTHTLLSANADPHEQALKLSERTLIAEAGLLIWLGPNFERYLTKALPAPNHHVQLGQLPGLTWPAGRSGTDLHLWLNPNNAKLMAQAIAERLCAQLPASAPAIQRRLSLLLTRIDSVAEQIKTRLAPVQAAPFGVYHDGYGHWVHYFGLNQVAALSAQPEQHPGAKHLLAAKQKLVGARCLISDFAEGNAQKLQELLQLPVQVADPLAQARPYADYGEFLLALADVFSGCLTTPG